MPADSFPFRVWSGLLAPEHHSQIGPALWTFLWLIRRTTRERTDLVASRPARGLSIAFLKLGNVSAALVLVIVIERMLDASITPFGVRLNAERARLREDPPRGSISIAPRGAQRNAGSRRFFPPTLKGSNDLRRRMIRPLRGRRLLRVGFRGLHPRQLTFDPFGVVRRCVWFWLRQVGITMTSTVFWMARDPLSSS